MISIYRNVRVEIARSARYSEDWSSLISFSVYVAICAPVSVLFQASNAANATDASRINKLVSVVVTVLILCFMSWDYAGERRKDRFFSTMGITLALVAWFLVLAASLYFCLDRKEDLHLFAHERLLKRSRRDKAKSLLSSSSPPRSSSYAKDEARVSLSLDYALESFDPDTNVITLRRKRHTAHDNTIFTLEEPVTEAAGEEQGEDSLIQTLKKKVFDRHKGEKSYDRYIRTSRPPIVVAGVLGALLVLALIGTATLSYRLKSLSRLADELNEIADSIDADFGEDPTDVVEARRRLNERTSASNTLDKLAKRMRTLQDDFNSCWVAGCYVGIVVGFFVSMTHIPRFDKAVANASKGVARLDETTKNYSTVGRSASLFGAIISITVLASVVVTGIVTAFSFVFVNDATRQFLWSYRYYAVSYLITFGLNYYVLEPYLFHAYASDGYRIKRNTAFMLCDIGWTAYGVVVGFTVAFFRVLYYISYSVVAVAFLDESILPPVIREFDSCYIAFFAAVSSHHRHHNALLHVFADALQESITNEAPRSEEKSNAQYSSRVKSRWHLAYTLLNNPSLRRDRRSSPPLKNCGDDDEKCDESVASIP